MDNSIFEKVKNSALAKRFRNIGYLPRWIIFLIDVSIVLFASMATHFIITSLNVSFYYNMNMPVRFAMIVIVNAFFFLVYRTYAGILRHSTFIDGVKLLTSTTTSYFVLLIFNYSWVIIFGQKVFITTALFISYVISFLLLFLFRILVKFFFEQYIYFEDKKKLINAVIYGADANAISVANALKTETPSRFRLVGFVDKFNHNKVGKSILNIPIITQNKKIHVILRAMKADALIIAEKSLSKEETIRLVEECLEFNFKIFTVPLITDWEDQQQISKRVKNFDIEDLLERKPIVLDTRSISSQLSGKTVLITGAAGSIGSEITRQVLGFKPEKIIILDQAETPLHNLSLEISSITSNVIVHSMLADIRNKVILEKIFSEYKPDVVYHAAAYKHVPLMEENPSQAVFTNVVGTKNLADVSVLHQVERFVMVSTDKAVNPSSVMGASKRIAEKYVQSLSTENRTDVTKFITTRFGNVLGSNGSIVPLFTKQIQEGGPITITHPEIIRYFMTIPEACQLVLEAGAMGKGGEIFIFDMGEPVKIIDLAKKMIRLAGYTPDKEIEIKIIGLRPGEKLYEELLNDTSKTLSTHNEQIMIAQDISDNYEMINAAIAELLSDFHAISNEEMVSKMKKIVPEFKSMNSVFQTLDK
ncbi:polysaccharide biosynthesis protein CapD [Flavobacterium noncentrifugens]|uniref:NDP-sugar epimerase, includes UDP-GlcNAc-inverting 4,6-dehydratase FlaA1 and capsular polysaccharide biosynthesis protein EpsC n=1 Tax=Flavobacterium noncentrifugens TaxID=1128970 RepID=A0A1G8V8E0_9FLAO|nr:nucleoside-diphosphate sugar epimerase/dehydratase [Flavobacterium noncentrifugens]GEP50388.1 polysaccharide biosynthesis protein CapD [Flavobacterium noncentrifugens]SDJ62348.1 NDP-sugar epimerase, includes UDP-GlcNAc-inverting 4,6-dehydratase FlaA1 and capsular polysaccharide biosynthesis protein EpsC [Flavobacterium noncentrifugens]